MVLSFEFCALLIFVFCNGGYCNAPPVFVHDMDGIKIPESAEPGSVLYQIVGSDAESEVIYSMEGGEGYLQLDPILGTVTLVRKVDSNLIPRFDLTLYLQDLPFDGKAANTIIKDVTVYIVGQSNRQFRPGKPMKNGEADNLQSSSSALFYPSSAEVTVNENWPIGLALPIKPKLTVIAPPSMKGLTLQLFVMPSDPSLKDAFTTDPLAIKGGGEFNIVLKNNEFLDLEGRNTLGNQVQIEVEARDPMSGVSARMPVTIMIKDVNEHKPMFGREQYTFETFENAAEGDIIGRITANDLDYDYYGVRNVVFNLFGSDAKYLNVVNPSAGVAELRAHPCWRKSETGDCIGWQKLPDIISVLARATDANATGLWSDVPLEIKVNRVNQHAPRFLKSYYETDILEETSQFNPVVQVEAIDEDRASEIMYRLEDSTGLFGIDPKTGILYVKHPEFISIENLGRRFNVTAFASDGLNPPASADISIRIMEHNEMHNIAPEFETENYEFTVPSGEKLVGSVIAKDPEDYFTYSIAQGGAGYFDIDSKTGEIMYSGPERVEDRVYDLQIMAMDSGSPPMIRHADVKTTIKGIGSHPVEIDGDKVITKHIRQDAPSGTLLHEFVATDLDEDAAVQFNVAKVTAYTRNGMKLDRSLEPELLQHIRLGNDGLNDGKVFLARDLTRSDVLTMHIEINVRDTNHPQEKMTTAHLLVSVEKVETPSYESQLAMLSIPESIKVPETLPVNSYVYSTARESAEAKRTRLESDLPDNNIVFSLPQGSDHFKIDKDTGDIFTKASLDQQTSLPLVVRATHVGSGMTKEASTDIKIMQQNNHAPVFQQGTYTATIPENIGVQSEVLKVEATDADGDKVKYSLSGKNSEYFIIDDMGSILTYKDLDREMTSVLDLYVTAEDKDSKSATVPISVFVSDVNDNVPEFMEKAYSAEIMENVPLNSHLLQVQANDADHPDSTTALTYGLINVPDKLFPALLIDPSDGVVRNKAMLNGLHGNYQFAAIAKDSGGKEVTVPIFLSVQSTTGCHPRIVAPVANDTYISLRENETPGRVLSAVNAVTDSKDCQVSYVLWDELSKTYVQRTGDFNIDSVTGEIKAQRSFDREKQQNYGVIVAAHSEAIYTRASLIVGIIDENDNMPIFPSHSGNDLRKFKFVIEENKPSFTALGSFRAEDPDLENNGKIYYHLMEASSENDDEKWPVKAMFQVDTAGRLLTRRPLDREVKSMYAMWILASNSPSIDAVAQQELWSDVERSDAVFVEVEVLDVNDNGPVFDKTQYQVAASSLEPRGRSLVRVHASDPDGSPDEDEEEKVFYRVNKVTFHSKGASADFDKMIGVDEETGDVTVEGDFQKFNDGFFVADIESLDSRNLKKAMTGRTRVKVFVHDNKDVVRLVVDERPEKVTKPQVDGIVGSVARSLNAIGLVKSVENHALPNGKASSDKIDVLAVFVNKTDSTIIPVTSVLNTVDRKGIAGQDRDLEIKRVLPAAQASVSTVKVAPILSPAAIALIIFACILCLGLLAFLLLLCYLRYQFVQEKQAVSKYGSKPSPPQITKAPPIQAIFPPPTSNMRDNPLCDSNKRPYEEREIALTVKDSKKAQIHKKKRNDGVIDENGYQTIERRL